MPRCVDSIRLMRPFKFSILFDVEGTGASGHEIFVKVSEGGPGVAERDPGLDLRPGSGAPLGLAALDGTVSRGTEIRERGSPGVADPKHPRRFSEELKRQIVQLCDSGKPVSEIGAEHDLGHSTVHRWINAVRESGSTRAADSRTPEQQRIVDLEKESKRLRMGVDVLKTAALIFARR